MIRWLGTPKKLSREQLRVLREAVRGNESVGVSAISLLEMAVLSGKDSIPIDIGKLLRELELNPVFQIVPFTIDVAQEVVALGGFLRDPADRAIVCTARVRKLRLLTSDERIIDSGLVPVVC